MKRNLYVGAAFLALLVALGAGSAVLQKRAAVEAAAVQAPTFEVDPMWPKPLPNHWLLGMVIGVSVDAQDHIWIIHRGGSLERMENYAASNPPAFMISGNAFCQSKTLMRSRSSSSSNSSRCFSSS